jgi:hypothetical protein
MVHYLLSVRQEKATGSGVGMNGCTVLFPKTCVHPCMHCSYTQYIVLLEYNVFEVGIGGLCMWICCFFPVDFSLCADRKVYFFN